MGVMDTMCDIGALCMCVRAIMCDIGTIGVLGTICVIQGQYVC